MTRRHPRAERRAANLAAVIGWFALAFVPLLLWVTGIWAPSPAPCLLWIPTVWATMYFVLMIRAWAREPYPDSACQACGYD